MLRRLQRFCRSILLRRQTEREMHDEMAEHLERATQRLVARGLTHEDARRQALREFGNVAVLQEEARDVRGGGWIDTLRADCRFALRHFGRRFGTTAVMCIVLIGGMSISITLFSFVRSYAVKPPSGVTAAPDLVRIRGSNSTPEGERASRSFPEDEFREYEKLTTQFASVAGWTDANVLVVPVGTAGPPLEGRSTFVTDNYFTVLGIRPSLGRPVTAVEAREASFGAVAVIGYTAWQRLFAGNPSVIGSTLTVNGVVVTVIGVAPEKFVGFPAYSSIQLWMPLSTRPLVTAGAAGGFRAVARLRPNVDIRTASAAVTAVAARTAERFVNLEVTDPTADVVPLRAANGDPMFDRDLRIMVVAVGLLGLLILLVACTNVSALLTGLATARRHEIAIRLSLGASRTRLLRQLLTESALIAIVSAVGALGVVALTMRTARRMIPEMPFEATLAGQETVFAIGLALTVGILFGVSPALHATKLGLASALRDSSASIAATRGRLQRGLVVAQIALTQPLIVMLTAVLLFVIDQVRPQQRSELGDRLVSLSVRTSQAVAGPNPNAMLRARARASMNDLVVRLRETPGIASAVIDLGGGPLLGDYVARGGDSSTTTQDPLNLTSRAVTPGYFDAIGITLVRGRTFTKDEMVSVDAAPTELPVIIDATLARRVWGAGDPVGQRLQAASDTVVQARTLLVVGVVDDPRMQWRKAGMSYPVYTAPDTTQLPFGVLVRTAAPAAPMVPTIRDAIIKSMPPAETPVSFRIRTIRDIEDENRFRYIIVTAGLSAAGLISLLLSAVGLYAVVAFAVGQRSREIAVRMAVGARPSQIVRRFVTDGIKLSAIGLGIGLPASVVGLSILMSVVGSNMPQVSLGPITLVATACVLLVATIAALLPARRAADVDPAITLRSE